VRLLVLRGLRAFDIIGSPLALVTALVTAVGSVAPTAWDGVLRGGRTGSSFELGRRERLMISGGQSIVEQESMSRFILSS
jgi:hypothetical protein